MGRKESRGVLPRRLLGILLVVAMFFGLMQGMHFPSEAAEITASMIITVDGVPESGTYSNASEFITALNDALTEGHTPIQVKLFREVYLNEGSITVSQGQLTIDLNGCAIGAEKPEGVINVASGGELIISDNSEAKTGLVWSNSFIDYSVVISVAGGKFTLNSGGISGLTGYGVVVDKNGTVKMAGGTIKGNLDSGINVHSTGTVEMTGGEIRESKSSGVYNQGTFVMKGGKIADNHGSGVQNTGTFTLEGDGEITGNASQNSAGGIYNSGEFILKGGKIKSNKSGSLGGGVYQNGTMKVSGNPVVTGNTIGSTSSNVRLAGTKKLNVAGALTEGASLGVTTTLAPTAGSPVVFTKSENSLTAANYADYFTSDAGYAVVESEADENELALAIPHTHDFLYFAAGSKITATCREAGCTVPAFTVTLEMKAPELTTYGAEGSPEMVLDGLDKFNKATGKNVDPDNIVYEGTGDTVYPESTTAPTAAGTYKATLTVDDMTIQTEYSIEKEEVSFTDVPEAAEDLVYTGENQKLVNGGSTEDGKLVYALGENDETAPSDGYTEDVPEMDKAGTYYVWYKVVGDENHDDTEPVCIVVVIAAKEVTNLHILMDEDTFTYDGTAKEPAVTVVDGTKEIPKEEYEVTYENNVNVGTEALVHVVNVEGSNYIFDSTAYFEILEPPYSYEWVRGKWYNKDGSQTYEPLGSWKKTGQDWMYVDESGWYPKNRWQKIDFKYYYFDANGIMEKNAYRNGWYLKAGGVWDGEAKAKGWKKTSGGWQYVLADGTLLSKTWMKIDGYWYYFYDTGIAAEGAFVQGWWLDFGSCRQTWPYQASWHKNSKGWWYGDESGWYAKKNTYTIDGVKYTFDAEGYWKES